MASTEVWTLDDGGHAHVVEITNAGLGRRIVWRRDHDEVASKKTGERRVQLVPGGDAPDGIGALGLHFGRGGSARRVTWYAGGREEAGAAALIGLGGVDFVPEPGSRAAKRLAWMEAHPRLYVARETGMAAGGVLGGMLATWLLARIVFMIGLPDIPWPNIPWPSIPWPDIPAVPWPDLPIPDWVREAAGAVKLGLPLIIAIFAALGEIRRRRRQEQRRTAVPPGDREQGGDEAGDGQQPESRSGVPDSSPLTDPDRAAVEGGAGSARIG